MIVTILLSAAATVGLFLMLLAPWVLFRINAYMTPRRKTYKDSNERFSGAHMLGWLHRDSKDGIRERLGYNESSLSLEGSPLPSLPYAYRHPEYWQKIREESKAGGDMIAARKMFDESERRHPLQEEEKIKVERIHGRVICIGAEDDALCDTCRYIRRMKQRLENISHTCNFEAWIYQHSTRFVFPESMLRFMFPIVSGLMISVLFKSGKDHSGECRATRLDIERRLSALLKEW